MLVVKRWKEGKFLEDSRRSRFSAECRARSLLSSFSCHGPFFFLLYVRSGLTEGLVRAMRNAKHCTCIGLLAIKFLLVVKRRGLNGCVTLRPHRLFGLERIERVWSASLRDLRPLLR
jgi:hypothetical protein